MRYLLLLLGVACGSSCKKPPAKIMDGHRIVYSVDLDVAVDDRATALAKKLRTDLASVAIDADVRTTLTPTGGVLVRVADPGQKAAARGLIEKLGAQVQPYECPVSEGPESSCVRITADEALALRQAALDRNVAAIKKRIATGALDATVTAEAANIVVDVAATDPDRLHRTRDVIARWGRLEITAVDNNAPFMRLVYQQAATDGKLEAEIDQFFNDAGATETDYYLQARDKAGLDRYLDELAKSDPRFEVPSDRRLRYGHIVAGDGRTLLRTYYLVRHTGISGRAIKSAAAQAANVVVELDAAGAKALESFTTDQVGKKIAVVLDGLVVVAPIVTTPLKGGRFTIPMTHPTAANELAVVLRAGPLAAPMLEETVNDLRGGKVIPNLE